MIEFASLPKSAGLVAGIVSATFFVLYCLTSLADRLRLIDVPGGRKMHESPTPTIGGLVIYIVVLGGISLASPDSKLLWMLVAVTVLVMIGVLDDAFDLSVKVRLAAQMLSACVMIGGGQVYVTSFGISLEIFDPLPIWFAVPFTILAIVGITNGFNMADGIDGLAAGYTLTGLALAVATMVLTGSAVPQPDWFLVLFSAVFVFFIVNTDLTPLRKVFLGDAGSMSLGFIMGWTLVYCSQQPINSIHPVAVLWCVPILVWDTIAVIFRRVKDRRSPFTCDRNHLHYILVDMGLTPSATLVIILLCSTTMGAFGILLTYLVGPLSSMMTFVGLMVTFAYWQLHSF